jgi:hypothetical protein
MPPVTTYPSHNTLSHIDAVAHELISERVRQIAEEGNTILRDDSYYLGEIAAAASCYAEWSTYSDSVRETCKDQFSPRWPWGKSWWKPKDRRRDLVRAGALIIAEIERLDRAASRTKTG